MKKKPSLLAVASLVVCVALFTASSAHAKSPQRYRWEGVAIGLGAALLGSALLHPPYCYRPAPPPFYRFPPSPPAPECDQWEVRRVWIPPRYDWVWVPGYWRRGCWVPGRWEKRLVSPGHWEERRYCFRGR